MISITLENFIIALLISVVLGMLAYKVKVVDASGMVSGIIVSMGILICMDVKFFVIFFSFVIIGAIFTAYDWKKKVKEKTSEGKEGTRSISNVLGNGLPALIFAMFYAVVPEQNLPLLCGYISAVAALAADTASSEIGVLSKSKPIMLTTFKRVEKGTDGGISVLGTFAGLVTTAIIAVVALIIGIANLYVFFIVILSGNFGNFVDSFIGATLERRKIFGKQETNFVCGISGGLCGVLLCVIFF